MEVVVEGIDGAGKDTFIIELKKNYQELIFLLRL